MTVLQSHKAKHFTKYTRQGWNLDGLFFIQYISVCIGKSCVLNLDDTNISEHLKDDIQQSEGQ